MVQTLFYIILSIVIIDFLFEKALDFLNDRKKSKTLPAEAAGIYDKEQYEKWLAYDKANGRVEVISSSISIIVSLVLLIGGYFGLLDIYLSFFFDSPVVLALVYFAVLGLGSSIISLPFSIYQTFVIEERFGFNKSTVGTFVLDLLKGLGLTLLIGAPLGALIIWIYYELETDFWWIAWLIISGFSLFMTMFGASIIMPLFNKFTPLPDGELRTAIENYCAKVDFKLTNLFVMDGSKRSSKSNAFFSGLGPKKKIALYDTLIDQLTTDQIVAVLAHEVGHYKKKHTAQSLVLSIVQTGIMLFLLGLFLRMDVFSQALGSIGASFHVGIIAFSIIFSPISTLIGIGMNMLSRKNEYEADDYAKSTFSGEALGEGLRILTRENLSNLKPHPAYVFVHYSHPTVLKRLANLVG
ncbi:MAG: M48 family metallopeptidase [Salibacteraceae bacterium]|jgi:STE24 endopeptidase|nr:M48 family metallopeptidase [Salibacteraceae bacterium]MDP4965232.1 M48 family metallopeptidase [Salibacteraceae bacterium]